MCENVVGLSYKPRADVPMLIQKKVILVQKVILHKRQAFQYKHTPGGTATLMWRLVTLRQSVRTLAVIWTSPRGIESLDKVSHNFILLKFCPCLERYFLTIPTFPSYDPVEVPILYSQG